MRACPRCGTANLDGAASCAACAAPLSPAPASAGFKQTMLGMATSPAAPAPPGPPAGGPAPAPAPAAAAFRGTMLGMPSPFAAPAASPGPAAPQAAHAAPQPGPAQVNPQAAYPPAPSAPAPGSAPAGSSGMKRTMLGFGGPTSEMAPTPAVPAAAPYGAPSPASAGAAPGSAPRVGASPLHQKTMLGVARPGIAPRHAGTAAPETLPSAVAAPPPAAPLPQLEVRPFPHEPASEGPAPKKRGGIPRGAIVLIAVAALLAVTAGVVAFLWESPRPIRAEVVLDDRGAEGLSLACDDCADGTGVGVGTSKAVFKAKKAVLPLEKPLDIGKNELKVSVQRPGIGRNEEIGLTVAVDYRVRGDLSALSEDPPKVKVLVQATPTSAIVVDGQPVQLDASGKGEHAVDVSRDLEGPAESIAPFERKLPYTVSLGGSPPKQGEVTLRFGIVPLRIDAPGNGIVIEGETFMLSGHTLKEGRISVSGRPITVDAEGRFAQLMNVSSIGETTIVVRAESKDHAPRLVRVRVKRVANLKDTAAEFRQSATLDYQSIADGSKKGIPAALEGEVVEARIDGEVTVLLLDVKSGCPASPCLARVIYGGRFDTKRGASLGAYGTVLGAVDGPRTGAKIPELAAEFLLPLKKKR